MIYFKRVYWLKIRWKKNISGEIKFRLIKCKWIIESKNTGKRKKRCFEIKLLEFRCLYRVIISIVYICYKMGREGIVGWGYSMVIEARDTILQVNQVLKHRLSGPLNHVNTILFAADRTQGNTHIANITSLTSFHDAHFRRHNYSPFFEVLSWVLFLFNYCPATIHLT